MPTDRHGQLTIEGYYSDWGAVLLVATDTMKGSLLFLMRYYHYFTQGTLATSQLCEGPLPIELQESGLPDNQSRAWAVNID